ncbi:MAG: glycosyltransferase family 25 protein [Pseudomonadota bacterium]
MNKKAFVIHLARATGRASNVRDLIRDCPVDTEIVAAVDGALLSASAKDAVYRRDRFFPRYPFPLRSTEIGCFLSHRRCWHQIVTQRLAYGMVFEDDARLDRAKAEAAIALAERHIGRAGFIQLPVRDAPEAAKLVAELDGIRLLKPAVIPLRLSGQLVSNWAAHRLLELTHVFDRPIDSFLQMHWITDIEPLLVVPSGIEDASSATGGSTISRHKPILDRLNREIRRFAYRRTIGQLSRRHYADV